MDKDLILKLFWEIDKIHDDLEKTDLESNEIQRFNLIRKMRDFISILDDLKDPQIKDLFNSCRNGFALLSNAFESKNISAYVRGMEFMQEYHENIGPHLPY